MHNHLMSVKGGLSGKVNFACSRHALTRGTSSLVPHDGPIGAIGCATRLVVAYRMADKFPHLVEAGPSPRKGHRDTLMLNVQRDLAVPQSPSMSDPSRAKQQLSKDRSKPKSKREA